jgi:hypothetical protein
MTKLLLSVFVAGIAVGQVTTPAPPVFEGPGPSLALRQYLDLTNAQVASIVRLNTEAQRFQQEKFRRQAQVNFELSQEMRRDTLDPMAIGLRFVELEAIRREIAGEQARVAREVQALLTAAQRTRIQALQDVLRTYPVACEALAHNLMAAPQQTGQMPGGMIGGGAPRSIIFAAPVCGGLGSGIRTGDFSGGLVIPPPMAPDPTSPNRP